MNVEIVSDSIKGVFKLPIIKYQVKKSKSFGFFKIRRRGLVWQNYWGTPKVVSEPYRSITIGWLTFIKIYSAPTWFESDSKLYWEMVLWFLFYSNRNIDLAENTYPWVDSNGLSLWNNKFLVNNKW